MEQGKSKKRKYDKTKMRVWLVVAPVFILAFLLLIGRMFQLQIIEGEKYRSMAYQQRTKREILTARRGSIYDRNNKILAQSARVWNVCISPAEMDIELLPEVAEKLGEILAIDSEVVINASKTVTKEGKPAYYGLVKAKIMNEQREMVEVYLNSFEEKVRWIYFQEDTKRIYNYDNLASSVLGFVGDQNQGAYGIESYYNSILSGTPGIEVSTKNAWGSEMPYSQPKLFEAKNGNSIVLTIDETIQGILEKNLEMAIIEHDIDVRADGILLNIKTGEVIAMASKPDFNPNLPREITNPKSLAVLEELKEGSKEYQEAYQQFLYNQWRNTAISDPYEPGSVEKIITAAISLEDKLTYLEDNSFYCAGSVEVIDTSIRCWWGPGHGQQTLTDIMRNSCNPGFVALGLENGYERTANGLSVFGYGKPTGIDLPGEANGIMYNNSSYASNNQVDLANMSFGQSIKVTPIQLASAIGAALNGGDLMQPFIVKQILDSEGNVIESTQPEVKRQVISAETSAKIALMVEAVVTNGSGSNASIPGYRIGGKTGTSEKLDLKPDEKYVLSFAGFAPMEDPTYVCLVILDEPHVSNPLGSVIAAPVVGAILQEALPYLGVEPQFTSEDLANVEVKVPNVMNMKPHDAQAELTIIGLKTKIVGSGSEVLRQVPQAGVTAKKGTVVTLYTEEEVIKTDIKVPSLVGLTAEEAVKVLTELGLNARIDGESNASIERVVKEQWPLKDSTISTGEIVILTVSAVNPQESTQLPDLSPSVSEESSEESRISEDTPPESSSETEGFDEEASALEDVEESEDE